jgi:hypothetical protein
MIQFPRVEVSFLAEDLRAGRAGDRFADEAGKRKHAEPVADPAERVAPRDGLS